MTSREQVVEWARLYADDLQSDVKFEMINDPLGGDRMIGSWTAALESEHLFMARATATLEFLRLYAGAESEWYKRGTVVYQADAGAGAIANGIHALGEVVRLWAKQLELGVTPLPSQLGDGVRVLASTDLMEQVRVLNEDESMHFAAPIVLAGAALETALRGAITQLDLQVDSAAKGIAAYGRRLREAQILGVQDIKDLEQIAGVRNSAAHGQFDDLSRERAGLMEQQVNLFLARLSQLLADAARSGAAEIESTGQTADSSGQPQ